MASNNYHTSVLERQTPVNRVYQSAAIRKVKLEILPRLYQLLDLFPHVCRLTCSHMREGELMRPRRILNGLLRLCSSLV